jgi:hypothetical protein
MERALGMERRELMLELAYILVQMILGTDCLSHSMLEPWLLELVTNHSPIRNVSEPLEGKATNQRAEIMVKMANSNHDLNINNGTQS